MRLIPDEATKVNWRFWAATLGSLMERRRDEGRCRFGGLVGRYSLSKRLRSLKLGIGGASNRVGGACFYRLTRRACSSAQGS